MTRLQDQEGVPSEEEEEGSADNPSSSNKGDSQEVHNSLVEVVKGEGEDSSFSSGGVDPFETLALLRNSSFVRFLPPCSSSFPFRFSSLCRMHATSVSKRLVLPLQLTLHCSGEWFVDRKLFVSESRLCSVVFEVSLFSLTLPPIQHLTSPYEFS